MNYKLLSTSIKKINLINELRPQGQIDLSANYHTDISFDEHNKRLISVEAQFEMGGGQQSESDSFLKVELIIVGIFEMSEEAEDINEIKNELHAALFSYVRAYITTLTALSGLPPITLPDMSIVTN